MTDQRLESNIATHHTIDAVTIIIIIIIIKTSIFLLIHWTKKTAAVPNSQSAWRSTKRPDMIVHAAMGLADNQCVNAYKNKTLLMAHRNANEHAARLNTPRALPPSLVQQQCPKVTRTCGTLHATIMPGGVSLLVSERPVHKVVSRTESRLLLGVLQKRYRRLATPRRAA